MEKYLSQVASASCERLQWGVMKPLAWQGSDAKGLMQTLASRKNIAGKVWTSLCPKTASCSGLKSGSSSVGVLLDI